MDRVKALEEYVKTLLTPSTMLDMFYPVGSYYETSDADFDPNVEWGGEWSLEGAGKFHVSAGTNYDVGATGGSANAIVPYHRHSVSAVTDGITGGSHDHGSGTFKASGNIVKSATAVGSAQGTITTGSSYNYNYVRVNHSGADMSRGDVDVAGTSGTRTHTHNLPAHNTNYAGTSGNVTGANMPPYIAVNRWHRTA